MEKPCLFVYKSELLEEYIQQITGLQVDRLEFEESGYTVDVTYYGFNKNTNTYQKYNDTYHIFDLIALIYKRENNG